MSYDPDTFHQIADLQKKVEFLEKQVEEILFRLNGRDDDYDIIDNELVPCDTE